MTELCTSEIDQAIAQAENSGDTLLVAFVAKAIASRCGGSPKAIAEELTLAGIKAGVTMQFGSF